MTKAGPISQPTSVSLRPRSRLSGLTSRETIPRSSMLIMSARAKTNTAYQARAGLGQGSLVFSRAILSSGIESAEILVASVLIKDSYENQPRRNEEHEERKEKIFVLFVSSWLIFIPRPYLLWLWRSFHGASPRTPIDSGRLRLQAKPPGLRRRAPSTLL